jgi:hypothetical protein
MSRQARGNRRQFRVEMLESRVALSGCSVFGQANAFNAQNPETLGVSHYGEHVSQASQSYPGAGGDFNRDGGIVKTALGC